MLKLAMRNCTRNLRRSVITGLSVFISVWALVVMIGFCDAVIDDMCENAKAYDTGEIRIRKRAYSEHEDVMPLQYYVEDAEALAASLVSEGLAEEAYPLSKVTASIYRGEELKSISLIGADFSSPYFKGKGTEILEGEVPAEEERSVLVTEKLLERFSLKVGDSVTIISRTAGGGSNGATYRISGVVSYNSSSLGGEIVIMPIDELSRLLHMDGALEILIRCPEAEIEGRRASIESFLSDDSMEVAIWHTTSFLYGILPLYDIIYFIAALLFFFISATLIFNTIMMSVLERRREISTLIALGFERESIRVQFILEGVVISLAAALISLIFTMVTFLILGHIGFDLTPFGTEAVASWGFSRVVYPSMDWSLLILITLSALLISALASFFATGRIRKIEVADALREEA